ncbi:MAG: SH3 domain-containing protein [Paracoccaceae bacterium]
MRRAVFLALVLSAAPLRAQDAPAPWPALHEVAGVAANDVLNLRAAPDAGAAIVGALAPDATGVEVVAVTDGWGLVNTGEGTGYAKMAYLVPEPGGGWADLNRPMACFGTEPFWSLAYEPGNPALRLATPEGPAQELFISNVWVSRPWATPAALGLEGGMLVLRPAECSDGMSDHTYGLAVDLFLTGATAARYSGCCSLQIR